MSSPAASSRAVARVLLVEDEQGHVDLMAHAFRRHEQRFELTTVTTVAAARARATDSPPDLILTDLNLPDGAGTELLDLELPVVIITSHGDERTAVRALKAGALDYVVKSIDAFEVMPHIAERALQAWNNIAERRHAEEQLRQSEERLAEAQRVARIGSWEWDPDHGTIWGTDEARRIFGIVDPVGVRTIDAMLAHVLDADRERMRHAFSAAVDPDKPVSESCRIARPDGAIRIVHITGQNLGADHDRVIGTVQDITERKRLEEEFLQAQKLEAIGLLASGVAHDINNLLMGIRGCLDVALSRMADGDASRRYIDEARAATESGADVTSQLLMFSRKQEEQPRHVEVDVLVGDTRQMIERLLSADVQLAVELAAPGARVLCAPGRLQQVLMNLVVNARDAMTGGDALRIATTLVTDDHGPFVQLSVRDSGCGMNELTRRRAFEPFFTTKPIGEGTGLGLSTTYAIVKRAGGHVELDSAPGVGTEFRILLPRAEVGDAGEQPAEQAPTPARQRETVLVVEDERLVRLAVRHYLKSEGYRVLVADSVGEGKRLARERIADIDLLLTDVVLPDGIGPDVVAVARQTKADIPCVSMSAYSADILERQYGFERDAPRLQKPFAREDLLTKVRDVLDARRGRRRAGPATILLVEDNAAARIATQALLEDLGYAVLAAGSGAEAHALFEEQQDHVELVLTDLGLPDVSGDALVRGLRAMRPALAALYISGRSLDDPAVDALVAEPASAYLQKPVDFDDVERALGDLLGR